MERASDVSVQVRGPRSEDRQCFFLLEEILGVIDQVRFYLAYQTLPYDLNTLLFAVSRSCLR